MTIDTTTIDSNYPIAGQSNSTQGFRTNFAATKTLLQQLQQQITDLTPGEFPVLSTVAVSGSYADLINKPTLFSGSYADLTDTPPAAPEPEPLYRGNSTVVNGSDIDVEFSVAVITTATTATLQGATVGFQLEGVAITIVKASPATTVTTVTVNNAVWSNAATITFTDPGETVTLLNVNNLWYITAINGAVYA